MHLQYPNMFTAAEMTDAVNKLPLKPMRLAGLFKSEGVKTEKVTLDLRHGRIVLVESTERGTEPASMAGKGPKRSVKVLQTAHLALEDVVRPEDIQDVRAFGTTELTTPATVINDKMEALKNNVEMTVEFHRLGAVQGVVYDADGTTVLHDMFETFDATKKTLPLKFATNDTKFNVISNQILAIKRHIETAMGGVPFQRIECLVGSDFYDMLTGHQNIRQYFENWLARQQDFGDVDYRRRGFTYAGITFFEASEVVAGRTMVHPKVGHAYPVGPGIFSQFHAPADWMETVNTTGLDFYARMDTLDRGRGFSIEVQSNPLTICNYPEALVEITATSGEVK